jgi:hypothetical protein
MMVLTIYVETSATPSLVLYYLRGIHVFRLSNLTIHFTKEKYSIFITKVYDRICIREVFPMTCIVLMTDNSCIIVQIS